ncbi:ribosomal protein, partial [Reticulomyxa filosa]
ALRETSYVGIPVIALCGVNNNTRFVDCAVPCNNRGKLSLGLMFWLLAREMLRIKKEIPRDKPWDAAPVDLFFYRNPAKKQELEQTGQAQQEYDDQGAESFDAAARGGFGIEQIQAWDQEPPRAVLDDWAAADVMIDQGYSNQQFDNENFEQPYYDASEDQAFGRVRMQEW